MPDLLIELFSEEIPARMQARAAEDLKKLVTDALIAEGLIYEGASAFATPRRLTLHVVGLPARQPDQREERKGPRVGAPEAAIQGFVRAAGLASIDEAVIVEDRKGASWLAVIERPGRPTADLVAAIMPGIIRDFPWPKSMRWGMSGLTWVRPLHSIIALFGAETEETVVVPFEVDGVAAGATTRGHRFMAPEPFTVRRFEDYVTKLERAKVVLDPARRRAIILEDARTLCFAQGLELVEDEAVVNETAGLVEWPVTLMGQFDESFLGIPPEVIQTTIRTNQKCFVVRDAKTGRLANRFVLVSNLEAPDHGETIIAGNARVIRARLSDARFFYETDLARRLEDRLPKLASIIFHAKLGTQMQRVERLAALARDIAPLVGADPDHAARAARLAKADLVTDMVGEFPELQGVMGRTYALAQGEEAAVAAACEDHYKPLGPSDRVPREPVSIAVALADKLDTLVGFWIIDEKPTGSKDPYALRRAALGVIRILVDNAIRLPLTPVLTACFERLSAQLQGAAIELVDRAMLGVDGDAAVAMRAVSVTDTPAATAVPELFDLFEFFRDRLRVHLRESGGRHELINAVMSLWTDDLLQIVRRVEALGRFLDTADGAMLLAGYRRAANILRDEEKKAGADAFAGAVDPAGLVEPAEIALHRALEKAAGAARDAVARDDFEAAMAALASLRGPIDAFFDTIRVNAEEPALRLNRLRLLAAIRAATLTVADFSKIEG